ncbi:MAG: sugar phosphate isomerase/epimerase family protein [Planctomycetota bacterium]|jgi:sugar phosphate isomerase/epimerase
MKTGMALYSFDHGLVDEFADMGFEAVSVRVHEERFRNHLDALVRTARERELAVTIHGKVNPGNFDWVREIVERLEGSVYSVLTDVPVEEEAGGERPRLDDLLAFREFFEEKNIYFGFEDLPLNAENLDAHFDKEIRSSPWFGVLMDIGHLNVRLRNASGPGYENLGEVIDSIPVPVRELHVHDNAGDRDRHAPIGYGNCRFEEIVRELARIGFDGIATIEIVPRISQIDLAECKRAAGESLKTWRELWAAPQEDGGSGPLGR